MDYRNPTEGHGTVVSFPGLAGETRGPSAAKFSPKSNALYDVTIMQCNDLRITVTEILPQYLNGVLANTRSERSRAYRTSRQVYWISWQHNITQRRMIDS